MNRSLSISYFITVLCLIQSVVVVAVVANDVCDPQNGICICKDHYNDSPFEDEFFSFQDYNPYSLPSNCLNPDGVTIHEYFRNIWFEMVYRINITQHPIIDENGNTTVIEISDYYDVTGQRFTTFCDEAWQILNDNMNQEVTGTRCLYWYNIQNPQEKENYFHFQAQATIFQQYQAQNQDKILRSLSTERQLQGAEYGNSVDWVASGHVAGVRNQGGCGSCYSFAATSALESHQSIQGGKFKDQSEQWAVDCSTRNNGCDGGFMSNVWADQKGKKTCTEREYPYTGQVGSCQDQSCSNTQPEVKGTGYVSGVDALASAVFHKGPVAVAIDHNPIMHYKSGVMSDCQGSGITHAVVVVGFVKNKYWLVRNSWGSDWGDNGYFKVKFGECIFITDYGQYPKIEKPDQDPENSLWDESKDAETGDVNMCDGYCDSVNPHGCSCTSDCASDGSCCTDFDYNSMCPSGNYEEDRSGNDEEDQSPMQNWCSFGDFCGYDLTDGTNECSCKEDCEQNKNCCPGVNEDCGYNQNTRAELGYCKKWGNYCGYAQRFSDGTECSCAEGCSYEGDCCEGAEHDCRYN